MPDPKIEIERLMKEDGSTFVRRTKHGEMFRLSNGQLFQLPGTPGDHRSLNNCLADLRRKLANDNTPEEVPVSPPSDHVTSIPYTVQKRRRVIETVVTTVTVDERMLAQALKLDVPQGVTVLLKDVDGLAMEGPFTLNFEVQNLKEENL